MNKRIKKLWTAALRSGKYKQGKAQLRRGRGSNVLYCCLGVLEDLRCREQGKQFTNGNLASITEITRTWAGLDSDIPLIGTRSAWSLNDGGVPFSEIADRIEKYL